MAVLRDFGDPEVLIPYEDKLRDAFNVLERRVAGLSSEQQTRIIVGLTNHLLEGIERAQEQADFESRACYERGS